MKEKISIITPTYNEAKNIKKLAEYFGVSVPFLLAGIDPQAVDDEASSSELKTKLDAALKKGLGLSEYAIGELEAVILNVEEEKSFKLDSIDEKKDTILAVYHNEEGETFIVTTRMDVDEDLPVSSVFAPSTTPVKIFLADTGETNEVRVKLWWYIYHVTLYKISLIYLFLVNIFLLCDKLFQSIKHFLFSFLEL